VRKIIAIIYGGDSDEWVISEKSAATVYNNLSKEKYDSYLVKIRNNEWSVSLGKDEFIKVDRSDFSFMLNNNKIKFDYAFIEIHGTPGEDGKLQGYFDMINVPYSTSGQLTSAITFDKGICTTLLNSLGYNVAISVVLHKEKKWSVENILKKVKLPCFVKPNNGGSSFGISKVVDQHKLEAAIVNAFNYDEQVMVEELMEGREVTNGAFSEGDHVVNMPVTEIITNNDFFDFEAKYEGAAEEITPADISEELTKLIQSYTSKIYRDLNLRGLIRIDYILIENIPHIIEVNTTPGLSENSLIPQQANEMGLTLETLFDKVINETS